MNVPETPIPPGRPATWNRLVSRRVLLGGSATLGLAALAFALWGGRAGAAASDFEVTFSEEDWKKRLSPEAFEVLRRHGTEYPGTSPLLGEHRAGIFACAGCALPLFDSAAKFESGTGWPSFWEPLPGAVVTSVDTSLGMSRNEVQCRRCGGHLGHVFDDGPPPTGLRYCINGVALTFEPKPA